jgi:hypothetical protein
MNFSGPGAERLREFLHLPVVSGEVLFHWLEEKIQYILDPGFNEHPYEFYGLNQTTSLLRDFPPSNPAVFEIPGIGLVEINSQRVGVVELGSGFFINRRGYVVSQIGRFSAIHRLSTLIHEARHNEGRGRALGFPHDYCHEFHPEAGQRFCDPCTNGPYAIQGAFLQAGRSGCDQCSRVERELLNLIQVESQNKVLPTAIECDANLQYP